MQRSGCKRWLLLAAGGSAAASPHLTDPAPAREWIEPSPLSPPNVTPPPVPPVRKKSGQKHQTARSPPPRASLSSSNPPTQPSQTTKSPYHNPEFSTVPTKTLSRFPRCRRPSLSSKRPLRACQLPPARLQSSSLNEIVNSARPRQSFPQTSTVCLEPASSPCLTTRRVCLFRAEIKKVLSHHGQLPPSAQTRLRTPDSEHPPSHPRSVPTFHSTASVACLSFKPTRISSAAL